MFFPANLNCQSRLAPGDKFQNIAHATLQAKQSWEAGNIFHCFPHLTMMCGEVSQSQSSLSTILADEARRWSVRGYKKKMRITQKEFEMLTRAFMEFFRKKKQHFIHLNICHFLCLSSLKRFFFRVFRLLFWRRASHAKKLYAFSAVDTAWWKNKRKEQVVGNFLAFHYDVRFDNMKIVHPVDLNEQMPQCRVRSFIATLFFHSAFCIVLRICIIPANI